MDNIRQYIIEAIEEVQNTPYITVGVSNRHIHLSAEDRDILFGKDYKLTPSKELQPGQYACDETVKVQGKKGVFPKVRILGPERSETQLEVSLTDTFALGIKAPVNDSGNLTGAGTVEIIGPKGSITRNCVIVARRHVHVHPDFAEKFGFYDKQIVSVKFEAGRNITFGDVLLRVSKDFDTEMHLDIDEANAGSIKNNDMGIIIP